MMVAEKIWLTHFLAGRLEQNYCMAAVEENCVRSFYRKQAIDVARLRALAAGWHVVLAGLRWYVLLCRDAWR